MAKAIQGLIAYLRTGHAGEHWRHQAAELHAYCGRHGLAVRATSFEDSERAEGWPPYRLGRALDLLAEGDGLIAADLRRLASSPAELDALAEHLDRRGAYLVCVAEGLDTGTREGRRGFDLFRAGARWQFSDGEARLSNLRRRARAAERRAWLGGRREGERFGAEQARREHGEKVRAGQARARAQGRRVGGRALADLPELEQRIHAMLETGISRSQVARLLNAEGVPPLRGGTRWWPASVPALETLVARRIRRGGGRP